MHNDYLLPPSLWNATTVVSPQMLRRLDQTASESIDGDNGGTWNPATPIVIGGAGALIGVNAAINGVTTGPRSALGGAVILSSQYLAVTPARARTTVVPLRDFLARTDDNTGNYNESGPGLFGVVTTSLSCRIPSQRIHKNFTPTSVTLRFRVGTRPAGVPTSMPGFNITRLPASGLWNTTNEYYQIATRANLTGYAIGALVLPSTQNGRQFRATVAGTSGAAQPAAFTSAAVGATVTDGGVTWVCETGPALNGIHLLTLPRPATVDAYFAQGNFQDLTFTPNAGGPWDSATYGHTIRIVDASTTANTFHSLRMTWSITSGEPNV